MSDEKWKLIMGFDGDYEVSSLGRVRSWVKPKFRLLEPKIKAQTPNKDGYLTVALYKGTKGSIKSVARLVLSTFDSDPLPGMEASHINGVRTDNRIENLKWESRMQNEQRKTAHKTRPLGADNGASKLTVDEIRLIKTMRKSGAKLRTLSGRFSVTMSNICAICKGRTWAHVR